MLGHLEGGGRVILLEPKPLLTKAAKMPGLDGRKMSKSYGNTISLRDSPTKVEYSINTMPTDPARVRRNDPGDPQKCPVWKFHEIYSSDEVKAWVAEGCTNAGIGCLECKRHVVDAVLNELYIIQQRASEFNAQPELIRTIVSEGCEAAREAARWTLDEVRHALFLNHR